MTEKENFQKHITTNFLQIKTAKKVEKNVISVVNQTEILRQESWTAERARCSLTSELKVQNKLPKFQSKAAQEG